MGVWYVYKNLSKSGVKPYAGSCPPYFDLEGTPWFDKLTDDIPAIREQTLAILNRDDVGVKEYYNTSLVENGKWESMAFLVWNMRRKLLKTAGKELYGYFKDIPGLVSLSISILRPGTHIKPHNGDTDATYRMHIPVVIPAGLPDCGIKVNGETRSWDDNKVVAFCDAYMHEAWNHSDKVRVILIVDVVRPEHLQNKRIICANVLSALLAMKAVQFKPIDILPFFIKLPIALIFLVSAQPFFLLLQRNKDSP